MSRGEPFRLAILTTGRQDWGLLRPLVDQLQKSSVFDVILLAGGMACSPQFGSTVDDIQKDYPMVLELPWNVEEVPAHVQSAEALGAVGSVLAETRPQALVLLGDRFETAAAALAATVLRLPIVHLHGGEETEGAIDNSLRHAITKMSHMHFVADEVYARRVIQMGEDPNAVHVVGSLGADNALQMETPGKEELEEYLGIVLDPPVGLVTVHPTTLTGGVEDTVVDVVVEAIEKIGGGSWVVTLPNSDPGCERIQRVLLDCAERNSNVIAKEALGASRYLGLMKVADLVLGNSSSGMIEAPAMGVPTVNVGDRQKGRLRFPSIIDVEPVLEEVFGGVEKALSSEFRARAGQVLGILGDGKAAERMVMILERELNGLRLRKRFVDFRDKREAQMTRGRAE
ncbi:MAG: UDP-N-acetylglucosamine 2-epimerase [Thermoanaerobaculales bacterium]|nr:UDP-N-acetylglucosamine 2-epimerase [Thermoanaerobaculales bacterium]